MHELTQGAYAGASGDMVGNLLGEFTEDAVERLRELDRSLVPGVDLSAFHRFAFEMRGGAHNFGLRLLEIVVQRLENYVSAVREPDERQIEGIRTHLDLVSDILEGRIGPDADAAQVVRTLPARPSSFSVDDLDIRNVEVMLVMLYGAQTRYVEREMQQCGYRVTIVTSTISALEQAVFTKPDLIIINAVMPGLSGIDLAVALQAMPQTRNTPSALITSFEPGDEQLRFLPERVPIIRKGKTFGDDLAEALSYHFLL